MTHTSQVVLFLALFSHSLLSTFRFAQKSDKDAELIIYHTSIYTDILPHAAKWHKADPKRKIGGFIVF